MEGELARLLVRRCARRPVPMVAWLALLGLPWGLLLLGPLGPDSSSLFSARLVYEVAFLWGLVGGLAALSVLGEITVGLDPLGTARRIRARSAVLLLCVAAPMVPLVVLALGPLWATDLGLTLSITLSMGLHMAAIGLVCAQVPAGPLRSIAFLSLAWLVPALVSAPVRGIVAPLLDATRHLDATSGSSAWAAAFAPILALVLMAIGVDGIRRPAP